MIDFATATPDAITDAYRAMTPGDKSRARTACTDAIMAAVRSGDIDTATRLSAIRDAMVAAPKSTPTVDYGRRVADMRATFVAAIAAIDAGSVTMPDGVAVPTDIDFSAGVADAATVARLVTVTGRKSGRGNVADFIASVVTDAPMTIAAIRGAWTASEDYPTAPPSSGAVAACLSRGDDDRFMAVDVDGKAGAVAV